MKKVYFLNINKMIKHLKYKKQMTRTYENRYGDTFNFKEDDNQDVLWEGNFEYCRIGMPNDYTAAYNAYCNDVKKPMSLEMFKKAVHQWDDETLTYDYPEYITMVKSLKDEIDMVDPSGGPYISRDMSLTSFGFKNYVVENFEKIDTGYKIITKKCQECHQAGDKHKMSCSTQK